MQYHDLSPADEHRMHTLAAIVVIVSATYIALASVPVVLGYLLGFPMRGFLPVLVAMGMALNVLLLGFLFWLDVPALDDVRRAVPEFVRMLGFLGLESDGVAGGHNGGVWEMECTIHDRVLTVSPSPVVLYHG